MENWGKNSVDLINNQSQDDEIVIDVKGLLYAVCKKWWLLMIIGILGAILAHVMINRTVTISYSINSTMSVTPTIIEDEPLSVSDVTAANKLLPTYVELIGNSQLLEEIAIVSNTGLDGMKVDEMLSVYYIEDTNIFNITIVGETEESVKAVMDAVIQVTPKALMEILPVGNIRVVDTTALTNNAGSNNPIKNILIGGVLGIVLAAVMICILELIKNPIRDEKDLEKAFGVTSLGSVPRFKGSKKKMKKLKKNNVASLETNQNISM